MNKILNINLGGLPFTLDEDAYERLRRYLDSLKMHFASSPSRDEIVGDIETRLAEILHDKLGGRSIASLREIEDAIAVMGTPADIEAEEPAPAPAQVPQSQGRGKRLYRNPDDVVVGGVCSGMSAYFGVDDPIWFRIGFVIAAFISFGMAAVFYIVLMIAVPKAVSPTEKLEMRGEPVNVDSIAKTVEEGAQNFASRISGSQKTIRTQAAPKVNSFFKEVANTVGPVFAMLLKVFVLFVVGSIGLGLASAWVGLVVAFGASYRDLTNFFFISPGYAWLTLICSLITIGVPIVSVIMFALRITTGYRMPGLVSGILTILWVLSLTGLAYVGMRHVVEFRDYAEIGKSIELSQPDTTLQIRLGERTPSWRSWISNSLRFDERGATVPDVHLAIHKSDSSAYRATQIVRAYGSSRAEAEANSNAVEYLVSQTGNILNLAPAMTIPRGTKYRGQEVELVLEMPVGREIVLDRNAARRLWDADIAGDRDQFWEKDLEGRVLLMTDKGLKVK